MPTPEELTIPDKLDSLNATKQAIREAIVAKGVEVPEGTTFYEYAGLIDGIETGGGTATLSYTSGLACNCYFVDSDGQGKAFNGYTGNGTYEILINSLIVVESGSTSTMSITGSYELIYGRTGRSSRAFLLAKGDLSIRFVSI